MCLGTPFPTIYKSPGFGLNVTSSFTSLGVTGRERGVPPRPHHGVHVGAGGEPAQSACCFRPLWVPPGVLPAAQTQSVARQPFPGATTWSVSTLEGQTPFRGALRQGRA